MKLILRASAGAMVAALLCAPAAAATRDQAAAVLAAAKAAMGGAAWDRIGGWHERGRHGDVAYETLLDFRRYGARYISIQGGKTSVRGFNGALTWDQGPDGKVTVHKDAAALADARQTAYVSIFAFFLPARFPARLAYLGELADAGDRFDAIRVRPQGATPMDVWVSRSTHYVTRLIDRSGPKPVTVTASDFRKVGGVLEPFHLSVSDGDPAHAQEGQVDSVVLAPVSRREFDPPR